MTSCVDSDHNVIPQSSLDRSGLDEHERTMQESHAREDFTSDYRMDLPSNYHLPHHHADIGQEYEFEGNSRNIQPHHIANVQNHYDQFVDSSYRLAASGVQNNVSQMGRNNSGLAQNGVSHISPEYHMHFQSLAPSSDCHDTPQATPQYSTLQHSVSNMTNNMLPNVGACASPNSQNNSSCTGASNANVSREYSVQTNPMRNLLPPAMGSQPYIIICPGGLTGDLLSQIGQHSSQPCGDGNFPMLGLESGLQIYQASPELLNRLLLSQAQYGQNSPRMAGNPNSDRFSNGQPREATGAYQQDGKSAFSSEMHQTSTLEAYRVTDTSTDDTSQLRNYHPQASDVRNTSTHELASLETAASTQYFESQGNHQGGSVVHQGDSPQKQFSSNETRQQYAVDGMSRYELHGNAPPVPCLGASSVGAGGGAFVSSRVPMQMNLVDSGFRRSAFSFGSYVQGGPLGGQLFSSLGQGLNRLPHTFGASGMGF